jgi:hypothetical protein
MERAITKEMVVSGYNQHLINLILSPNGDGIACQIGDNWFYFDGSTAEEYDNVAEYKEVMLTSDIITNIYNVLCEFKTEFEDEYLYYYYYLIENLKLGGEKMNTERLLSILKNAIVAYESELEQQNYETEEELHKVVLNEFGMTENEYNYVFKSEDFKGE